MTGSLFDTIRIAAVSLLLPCVAFAGPITIESIDGDSDGGSLGGYDMTAFTAPETTAEGETITSVDSPIAGGGTLDFTDMNGDPLGMRAYDPDWWQYDHGNVYVTSTNWIELLLPAETRAFSFWVGAAFTGRAWIQAFDGTDYSTERVYFGVGDGNTSGYGVYTADACSSITRIIIEPTDWGTGNFSINQGGCTDVPAPGTLGILGLGLLGIALTRKLRRYTP